MAARVFLHIGLPKTGRPTCRRSCGRTARSSSSKLWLLPGFGPRTSTSGPLRSSAVRTQPSTAPADAPLAWGVLPGRIAHGREPCHQSRVLRRRQRGASGQEAIALLDDAEVHSSSTARDRSACSQQLAGVREEPDHAPSRIPPPRSDDPQAIWDWRTMDMTGCSNGVPRASRRTSARAHRCPGGTPRAAPTLWRGSPISSASTRPRSPEPGLRATHRWGWPRSERCAGSTPPRRVQLPRRPRHVHPHLPCRRAAGAAGG